jgi:hypothetical protein
MDLSERQLIYKSNLIHVVDFQSNGCRVWILIGTGVPDHPSGVGNYRFGGDVT